MGILEETQLIYVESGVNSNKFYKVTLYEDGSVHKNWGRVGASGQTSIDRHGGRSGYESIINQKKRKGYEPTNAVSLNTTESSSTASKNDLKEIARKTLIKPGNSELERLVDLLVAKNNHEIIKASGGKINVSDNGLITTPLGLVSLENISQARAFIDSGKLNASSRNRSAALDGYLKLIPQQVPRMRGWDKTFLSTPEELSQQSSFLDQLEESLDLYAERRKASLKAEKSKNNTEDELAKQYADLFRYKVSVLDDDKEFKRIERLFRDGLRREHSSSHLRLKRVYVLNDPAGLKRFKAKAEKIGDVRELWHGTRVWNVLSILRQGLILNVNDVKTIQTAGAMFGSNSIYTSSSSSKSLNYSYGYWDGGIRSNNCFMFLNDVAMGRTHVAERNRIYHDSHIQKSGKYDSLWAKGRTSGVLNDEMIIWDTDQINIKYLCEFDR